MENSKPLATESFSYSWLTDRQPKFRHYSNENEDNFNFDVPAVISSPSVHADDIFSDGQIRPVYLDIAKLKALDTSTSYPATPVSSRSSFSAEKNHYYSLGRWRKSSKKIFNKCFRFVKPFWRTSSRVDDLERKVFEVQSCGIPSLEVSPRTSSASSVVEWSTDFKKIGNHDFHIDNFKNRRSSSSNISSCHDSSDAENSIHEAILYCKRSIGL